MPPSIDWRSDTIARLEALWAGGHSTAEIGRRLGVTKNAVIGKAHRLKLPARPSPLRTGRRMALRNPTPRRVQQPSQPPPGAVRPNTPPPAARPAPIAPCTKSPARADASRDHTPCCWPLGEPGRADFRFCDAAVMPGRPYCGEHCRRAYPNWLPPDATMAATG